MTDMMTAMMGSESPFQQGNQVRPLLDPERIRSARETLGLSKTQLAERLGVTPRTVMNYEKDGAPFINVEIIARALEVMPSFLTALPKDPKIQDLTLDQVWFRSMRKSTVTQRKEAVGHGRNSLLLFRWIGEHFVLPKFDFPAEGDASLSPEAASSALRGVWGFGENPLPSMMKIAEAKGVRLFSLPSVGKEVDAFSFIFGSEPYIAVDVTKSPERVRFDIAHEIGHLLMHATTRSENAPSNDADMESQAHAFASNLLMPQRRVLSVIPSHPSMEQIFSAKRYFGVSAFALVRRIHELRLLTDWEYRSVCSWLGRNGYRTSEKNGIDPEFSTIFQFVTRTNREKKISVSTVSEETGLRDGELHALSFGNFFAVKGGDDQGWNAVGPQLRPKLTVRGE